MTVALVVCFAVVAVANWAASSATGGPRPS